MEGAFSLNFLAQPDHAYCVALPLARNHVAQSYLRDFFIPVTGRDMGSWFGNMWLAK